MSRSSYTKISITSLGTLAVRVIDAVKDSNLNEAIQCIQFNKLCDASEVFQQSVLNKNGSEFNKLVSEKDEIRDNAFVGLRKFVQAHFCSPTIEEKKAAEHANEILEWYGSKIEALPHSDESIYIEKIIDEFKKPSAAELAKVLNLHLWLSALEEAQAEFKKVFEQHSNESVARNEIDSSNNLKKTLVKQLGEFMEYVSAMQIVNDSVEWKELGNRLQKEIDSIISSN